MSADHLGTFLLINLYVKRADRMKLREDLSSEIIREGVDYCDAPTKIEIKSSQK